MRRPLPALPATEHGRATCDGTTCDIQCDPGFTRCGNSCVDVSRDLRHCGGCGQACGVNETCENGQCVCFVDEFGKRHACLAGFVCCNEFCSCQPNGFYDPLTCENAGENCPAGTTPCVSTLECGFSDFARICCPTGTTCDVAGGTCRYA